VQNGAFVPDDWTKIVLNSVVWARFPHMLLAAYLTGAFCVAATGAWYLLRNEFHAEAHIMLGMGLFLAAVLASRPRKADFLTEYRAPPSPSRLSRCS
jgi:cytochrome bd ubiquinol oxidase subunit I